jgi:hypothetical protein
MNLTSRLLRKPILQIIPITERSFKGSCIGFCIGTIIGFGYGVEQTLKKEEEDETTLFRVGTYTCGIGLIGTGVGGVLYASPILGITACLTGYGIWVIR